MFSKIWCTNYSFNFFVDYDNLKYVKSLFNKWITNKLYFLTILIVSNDMNESKKLTMSTQHQINILI